jgi:hypothetical protein
MVGLGVESSVAALGTTVPPGRCSRWPGTVTGAASLGAPLHGPERVAQLAHQPGQGEKHVSDLLAKLGVANRTEAVTRARQLGLIP